MKTPQEVIVAHQQRSDPHDNHCICGFGDDPRELGLSWAEHVWTKLREEAGIPLRGPEIGQVRAETLRDAAESIGITEVMFTREDGSQVRVTDLLREYAENYERPGITEVKAVLRHLLGAGYKLSDTNLPEAMFHLGIRVVPESQR